jgi:fructokinase
MSKKVLCFGEALWDNFPDYKEIGGAPLNVAFHLKKLGVKTEFITRVGEDKMGSQILEFLNKVNFDNSLIQIDKKFNTGEVNISLDKSKSANYIIKYPCAWDKIEMSDHYIKVVKNSDFFVFGSLISRDKISRETLLKLIDHANFKIFDVNIRDPYYDFELISFLMQKSNMIKFNEEELERISKDLGVISNSIENKIIEISKMTSTELICLTLGEKGVVFYDSKFHYQDAINTKVLNTVGAGDSFLAMLIEGIISNKKPELFLKRAAALSSFVCSKYGPNPEYNKDQF